VPKGPLGLVQGKFALVADKPPRVLKEARPLRVFKDARPLRVFKEARPLRVFNLPDFGYFNYGPEKLKFFQGFFLSQTSPSRVKRHDPYGFLIYPTLSGNFNYGPENLKFFQGNIIFSHKGQRPNVCSLRSLQIKKIR
jgi:hypothetical protein